MLGTSFITFNSLTSAEECLDRISRLRGKIDIYSWFEGPQGMPMNGATSLRDRIYKPLYSINPDATLILYSLKGWDFFNPKSALSTLSNAINRMNQASLRSLSASDFFNYADEEGVIQSYLGKEIAKKKWLLELSERHKEKEKKTGEIFKGSLLSLVKDLDIARCYAFLQYVEGYFLIQRSIRLSKSDITIVFLLPNDEAKYYRDYPDEIEKLLKLDFGSDIQKISIRIEFLFFQYGESISDRPYIDKSRRPEKLKPEDMASFFNYLNSRSPL